MQIAKISRPIVSRVLPRQRLFRLIDHGRRKPVLWVSGPPGSGKTSLVCSYLDARRLPCLWYQVDEGDSDIATFFYYMGLAGKKAAPQKKKPLPVLTPEYLPGLAVFTKRYFENLYGRLQTPSVVVLDNYQEVPDESPFHEVIREGLSSIPEAINIIVISRRDMPNALARMRAGRMIEMLGWDELKFTLDESKKVINVRCKGIPAQTAEDLHHKTDGWAAGLVLSTEGLRKEKAFEAAPLDMYGRQEMFGYFAGEIFDKTETGIQDFLLKTAFFPKFSPSMAESLTGNAQAHDVLTDLSRANYFTQRHSYHGLVHQYHPLFREFLLERGKKTFTTEDVLEIQRNAALILEANDQVEDAVDLFKGAGDWSHVVSLILRQAPAMVAQGRWQTLECWIGSLPESMVQQNPWLLYWLGMCQIPCNPVKAGIYFENAYTLFRNQDDTMGMLLALSARIDSIAMAQSSFKEFDFLIAEIAKLFDKCKMGLHPDIEARVTNSMLYAIVFRQPNYPDAEVWVERGLFLTRYGTAEVNVKVLILMTLSYRRLISGELSKAASLIDAGRELTKSPYISPVSLVFLKAMEAFYYWLTSEFEEGRKAVDKGLAVSLATGAHANDTCILGHAASGSLNAGDLQAAERFLQRMSSLLGTRRGLNAGFHSSMTAWLALLRKDLHQALYSMKSALELAVEAGTPQTIAVAHFGMALVMYEFNRPEEAARHHDEVRKIARQVKILQIEFGCYLAEARFAFGTGNEKAGLVSLARAMSLGKEQQYTNTFLFWHPDVMAELCPKALDAGIEVEYVRHLIRKRNLVPKSPPLECENWPFAVRIFTLGRFSLVVEDKPVALPKKAQKKPLAMLKALIALGGREVSEERLSNALWPDADGDLAHESFTTTLHRLRRMVGSENFIRLHEGRLTLDPRYCWVDIWALERILKQRDSALNNGDPDRAIRLTEEALSLYHGPFLSEDPEPWIIPMQERLRSKFIRSVGKMGVLFEEKSEWDKAVEYYQKGLEAENTAESFYQHLMICYHKLGRQAEATSIYQRCCKTLSAVLGVKPSAGTVAVYHTVRGNQWEGH